MPLIAFSSDGTTDIDATKAATDLRVYLADRLEDVQDHDRYLMARCLSPEHPDEKRSMAVYSDQARCFACGYRADIFDFYRAANPGSSFSEAARALLERPDLKFTGELPTARSQRTLDPDTAIRRHFSLAGRPDQLAALAAYGLVPASMKKFRIGLAAVPVRLEDGTFEEQERWSVPVYAEGKLKQYIYRKSRPEQGGGKTTAEKDAGSWLFNQDVAATASTLVLCEGWSDVIVLDQWGISAVTSTVGAGSWRSEWTELLGNVRRLYVVADADEAGQKMVRRVRRDIPWVRPLKLPWPMGSKQDVRDLWLAGWRRADFLKLMREADIRGAKALVTGGTR